MDRQKILSLTPEHIDRLISRLRGDEAQYSVMAMNDIETTYIDKVGGGGSFHIERGLRNWLRDEHIYGRLLEYHIVKRRIYPVYSTDPVLAKVLLDELTALWQQDERQLYWLIYSNTSIKKPYGSEWAVQIAKVVESTYQLEIGPNIDTFEMATCRAYLLWRARESR